MNFRKYPVLMIVLFLIVVMSIFLIDYAKKPSSTKELFVGSSEKYNSIQEAVDASFTGDTIIVKSGEYRENIKISNSISLIAEDNVILTPADINQPAILVSVDNVEIEGFSIENVTSNIGIFLNEVNSCVIKDNSLNFNTWGIVLRLSSNCKIINNSVKNHTGFFSNEGEASPSDIIGLPSSGIQLIYSDNNVLQDNYLLDNLNGIDLSNSKYNLILNNIVKRSERIYHDSRYNNGIGLFENSSNNTLKGNLVENYQDCIDLGGGSSNVYVINNTASNCGGAIGVNGPAGYCVIENNIAKNSALGIYLWVSVSHVAINNNTAINNGKGVWFYNSSDNVIDRCLIENNKIDIHSQNSNNRIINCAFENHEEDSSSSLILVE